MELCAIEREREKKKGDSQNIRHETDSTPTTHPLSWHRVLKNTSRKKTDKTCRCPMAISAKTSSSVSEKAPVSEPAVN